VQLWVNVSALVEPNLPLGTSALDLVNARRAIANAGIFRIDNVTLVHDRPLPDPPLLSMPAAIVASVRVGSAASGVASSLAGNPIMAIQAARTSLILQIAQCDLSALDEGPDRFSYPIGVPLVTSAEDGGLWIGAALLNPGLCLGTLILHFSLAALTSKATAHTLATAKAMTFFPALQSVVILLLLQPTVQAATIIFRSLVKTPFPTAAFVIGAVGGCCCLGFLLWLMLLTVFKKFSQNGFGASLVPFPAEEKPHCIARFLIGDAEWVDRPQLPLQPQDHDPKVALKDAKAGGGAGGNPNGGYDVFCRQYFLYFDAYRPATVWYMCVEVLWTIGFGILDGWGPLSVAECKSMMLVSTILFGLAFLAIVFARPYIAPFELLFALLLSLLQAASAAATLAYAFANADIGLTLAGWGTTAATYALLGKSAFDLILLLNDIRANLCTTAPLHRRELLRQTARATAVAEAEADNLKRNSAPHSSGRHPGPGLNMEVEVPLLGVPGPRVKGDQSLDRRVEEGVPFDSNPLLRPAEADPSSSEDSEEEPDPHEAPMVYPLSSHFRTPAGWDVAPEAVGVRSRRTSSRDRDRFQSDLYSPAPVENTAIPWLPLEATEPPNSRLLKLKNRAKRKPVTLKRKFPSSQIWI
jgi:hypothetical protein